jgi:hypothetical protein
MCTHECGSEHMLKLSSALIDKHDKHTTAETGGSKAKTARANGDSGVSATRVHRRNPSMSQTHACERHMQPRVPQAVTAG